MRSLKYFAIKDVMSRLAYAADRNRFDQITRTMHDIYEKRCDKNPNQLVSNAEFKDLYSTVSNLNNQSNFKDLFEDILSEDKDPLVVVENSSFKLSGFDGDDFRPTPVEREVSLDSKIQASSEKFIKRVAAGSVVNPQYYFGNLVRVANAGKNSGVALWTVSFNTGKGIAKINVPIRVISGEAMLPEIFYTHDSKNPIPFTEQELSNYAKNYSAPVSDDATEKSGFSNIGINSYLTDNCNIKEGSSDIDESVYVSVGEADFTGDGFISDFGGVSDKYIAAIEAARKHVGKKISYGSSSIQLKFGGVMTSDGKDVDIHNPSDNMIVAFNAQFDTKNGKTTITIPVTVANDEIHADKFYTSSGSFELNPSNITEYVASQNVASKEEIDPDTDAFSKAFLASSFTLDQLKKEIKLSVQSNDMIRAKSCLHAIGSKFGDKQLKIAMADFLYATQESKLIHENYLEENSIYTGQLFI